MTICSVRRVILVAFVALLIDVVSDSGDLGLDILYHVWALRLTRSMPMEQINSCNYLHQRTANRGSEVQDLAEWLGAVPELVKAMRAHTTDVSVQCACGHALEAVSTFNRKTSLAMADAGAIEAVVNALRNFPLDRNVQMMTAALSAFNDLAPENRPRILDAGGVELVMTAMVNHYHDGGVLFRTGCAISATSGDQGVADAIADFRGNGTEFLMQMMRDHLGSWRVGQEIMQATRNMMHIDVKHRERLLRAGFVKAAVDTIRSEMHERGTPSIGSTNLAMLAYHNRTMQDAIAAEGAIELILHGMERWFNIDRSDYGGWTTSQVWPLLPSSLQALWTLSWENPLVQGLIVEGEGLSIIGKTMGAHTQDMRIQRYGCATLAALAKSNVSIRDAAVMFELPGWCKMHLKGNSVLELSEDILRGELGRY
mmetsp:Transcript_35006/g.81213  ORF Transcript_35006/g.81213 Transcript_35006/m.81213 type:complete len:426 (+) Transcript_35006:35-1312(+)|eukprot:CAMPEP_0171108564 /NCGR_PEP_ID=MMETSP0766_2-20121228/69175_1 /TAXON_ID=439317 /ORGANISM="Gambierdiscus australes, Strain CAWD 149" /LENGTH=425 /DNA_ID=CAMNT_0011570123 /DNA_START=35 /DNA_END=1312 /DNA_ORIENTATION=-